MGDVFGQARLNAICKAVNESVDQAKVIESVDDLKALTEAGFVVGGKAGAQIISNLGGLRFYEDESGKYVVGADSAPKKLGEPMITGEIDVEATGITWHDSGTYNVGAGYTMAYLIFTRVRTGLNDHELKIDQSYDPSTGIISYSFSQDQKYDGNFTPISCRQVRYIAFAY